MKIAKYAFIACLLTTGFTATAQEETTQVSKEKKEKAIESLELSEDQRAEIEALREETRAKLSAIKADEAMDTEAKRAEMKAIKKENKAAMNEILTEEQRTELAEIKSEKKAARKEITPGEVARKQTDKMKEVIELTEEQEEKVYLLNLKVANKIDAIKKDENMTSEKKREFIKGNKEDQRRSLEHILSTEQMETWEAHLASKKKKKKAKAEMKKMEPAIQE